MADLKKSASIVGVYEHPSRYAPEKSEWLIQAESAIGALEDAGLKPGDIDAYFTSATAPEGGISWPALRHYDGGLPEHPSHVY